MEMYRDITLAGCVIGYHIRGISFHSVFPAGEKTCRRLEKSQVKFTALLMNA